VLNGAGQVECTINGIGERGGQCGDGRGRDGARTREAYLRAKTNIVTEEIINSKPSGEERLRHDGTGEQAIVGANAFAHESGIHRTAS
jgi:2-isopropylmalate synthase